ncbi:MAG: hypothetical protein WDZ64_01575 [Parcubacteria group bacterium]
MRNISSLLEKISHLLDKDSVIKDSIQKVVEEKTRVKILKDNFILKEGVLEISSISPTAKNEINLKETLIKKELKDSYNIIISRIFYK